MHTYSPALAVVTGASREIGRAVAVELTARGLRDDRHDAQYRRWYGPRCKGRPRRTARRHRPADDLAAGRTTHAGEQRRVEDENLPIEHLTLDMWQRMFATNVFGLAEVTRHTVPRCAPAAGA